MKRSIRLLSIWNFLTDFSLFAPVAILYFARVSGSYTLGMSIFSAVFLTSAILEVPTGIFSDLIGRKKTMILGTAMGLISTVMYALGWSYLWLVIGAIFEGAARSFYSGNNDAYLHDILSDNGREKEFHTYLGKVSAMFQVALATSALLGGVIAQWSFTIVVWLNVVPSFLKLLVSFALTEPKTRSRHTTNVYHHLSEAIGLFTKNSELRLLALASMLSHAIGESKYQFRSAFVAMFWPVWAIGVSAMMSNVLASISYYLSGKVINKFKEIAPILVSDLSNHMLNFAALVFPGVHSPALMAGTSLFFGIKEVAKNSLMQKQFTAGQRATMGSLTALGGSLMIALLSLILGSLADYISPRDGLLIFQIISIIPTLLFFALFRKKVQSWHSHLE